MTPHFLSAEQFEALLRRLSPDREQAGARYEQLRRRLITVFAYRGCVNPDELADQTLDRVARKLREQMPETDAEDVSPFVFGVAWNVARESFRVQRPQRLPEEPASLAAMRSSDEGADERREHCLDRCLASLDSADRELVLSYFHDERRARIARRALLARQRQISANALRVKICRITATLRSCTSACMDES